ncbi:MAG: phenylalanine--tRNA ligase subunit beta [Bacteroidales bacterium]|jgi:phenylalanyl-tRNA synthetase beta chain
MKISYNWLKQYINLDVTPEIASKVLTDIGLEVEATEEFQSVKGGLKGVVVGEVITCERHANADKLSVTTVDIGTENLLPIVCGAPNVAAGQKVLVATVGTRLYSGDDSFEIKKSKIRGEVSEGMICAEDELGLGTSHDGIMVLPAEVKTGTPASEYYQIEQDVIFEIGLTPNRADAASHIGVARDLAAGLNREYNTQKYQLKLPEVSSFAVENTSLNIEVEVLDSEACPRYSGVTLSGITIQDSPSWLKEKLMRIGLRPVNNIVDVTNYVLHETGQPLHAFDADKITGSKVVVRKLSADTLFTTLDGEERKLNGNDLMICNAQEGMCIAGVFGGLTSGVTQQTTSIFLESACFDSRHIRKTSKYHGLQTDASFRFERGADPNITVYALKRAILLMKELAGGVVTSEIKDVYPQPVLPKEVAISFAHVDRLIGKSIERPIIKTILNDLEISVLEENETGLLLSVPTFKVDVTREVDIIEEILRIYGINNIDSDGKLHTSLNIRQKPDVEKIQQVIADYLVGQGMVEMMNNSLTRADYAGLSRDIEATSNVELLNPLSKDLNVMRQSLLFGGLEVIAYNVNRKENNLKLFEFGNVYLKKSGYDASRGVKNYHEEKHLLLMATGNLNEENWNSSQRKVGFYDIKSWVEALINRMGIDRQRITLEEPASGDLQEVLHFKLGDKLLARVGSVGKKLLQSMDIKQDVFVAEMNWTLALKQVRINALTYTPVSKFPSVRRDLALLLDKEIQFSTLQNAALQAEKKLLQSVNVFDVYEGEKIPAGKKSYALSFILEDSEKTMTDKVIEKTMGKIQQTLKHQFNAELR